MDTTVLVQIFANKIRKRIIQDQTEKVGTENENDQNSIDESPEPEPEPSNASPEKE